MPCSAEWEDFHQYFFQAKTSFGTCVPLSPKGKAFLYIPKWKTFLYLYIMLIHILFCSAIHYMDIVIWISIAPLYKTTSKFFHVKFFIVPLKLLDTLYKHGYNIQCKIVCCRSQVLKIHRIGLQGFKPQSIISKEKYFSFRLWRKDFPKWEISPKDWRARRKICNDGLERYV